MNVDGIIFDFDGTLMDSMYVWQSMDRKFLLSLGKTPKPGLHEAMAKFNMQQASEYLRREYELPFTAEEIIDGINDLATVEYIENVKPKDGVVEAIKEMHSLGIKMCVATTNVTRLIKTASARFGIDKYFSAYFSGTELKINKDTPEIYELALAHLGTSKKSTWVFEDVLHAVQSAKSGGFNVAAVFDEESAKDKDEILKSSDIYINSMREWKKIYG